MGGAQTGAAKPPLDGITVVDIGQLVGGPMAAGIMGDFGARVIKVEDPNRPDSHRKLYEKDGIGLWARADNRNKECIALDLKTERGKEIFTDLLRICDVLVENFRPGVLERLGFAPDRLLDEVNPGLVVCRVSGWGQSGPWADRGGYGRMAEAASGLANLNGMPDGPPMHTAASLGDTIGALWAAYGVLLALRARDRDGRGQVVDVALYEGLLRMIVHQIVVKDQLNQTLTRVGNENPGIPTVNVFETGDGKWFTVANATPRTQAAFIELVGLAGDPELGDIEGIERNRDRFNEVVRAWMRERTIDEVDRLFHEAGAVGSPVWSADEIVEQPHILAREMVVSVPDQDFGELRMPGVVPKLDRTPGSIRSGGEELGQSTDAVLAELLGLTAAELEELHAEGVT
jgi:formyl-CoA transferase